MSSGEACAVYNLSLDDDADDVVNEDIVLSSKLQLRLQWPGPRHILEQPSPDSKAVIDAWISPGGNLSLVHSFLICWMIIFRR